MDEMLTNAELSELRDAGVVYPWNPRQSLRLLRRVRALEEAFGRIHSDAGGLDGTVLVKKSVWAEACDVFGAES